MKSIGVGESIVQTIIDTCLKFGSVNKILIYGSRARGDFRQGSDIDIAIDAPKMDSKEFAKLWNMLDDLPIIYPLDVVHLQQIKDKQFLEAISKDKLLLAEQNTPE